MIIICDYCEGTGYIQFDVGTHKSEYVTKICETCNGSGRLNKKVSVTFDPFIPDKNISTRKF